MSTTIATMLSFFAFVLALVFVIVLCHWLDD